MIEGLISFLVLPLFELEDGAPAIAASSLYREVQGLLAGETACVHRHGILPGYVP